MEIYTMIYISLYNGQLWSETNVYNNIDDLEKGYKEGIRDIAENIDDDDEREQFLEKYKSTCDGNAHWENWDGTEMYALRLYPHTIEYRDDFWD